ncbi:hypothetical protein AB0L97_10775 [Nocardia sp. NPDC051911]|uniref:hypothetical protein n=1 Tax=Nocardia sp. NPDC051911 TaxID=3154648 RepID=UPI00343F2673
MTTIKKIIVVHSTANVKDAGSDAVFELQIERLRPGNVWELLVNPNFPSLPHDERERGLTDLYSFDFSDHPIDWSGQTGNRIAMRMLTREGDGWLPKSIFVIGIESGRNAIVLGSHPAWPRTGWFDNGSDALGPEAHIISGFS